MDLIGQLASTMGIDETQAQALAGGVLGAVKGQMQEQVGGEAAAQLDAAVPELGGWAASAESVLGAANASSSADGGMLGGLMSMAGSGVGNQLLGAVAGEQAQQTAMLIALAGKLGIDESKAGLAAPLVLSFLKDRLPAEWIDKAMMVAPFLTDTPAQGGTPDAAGAVMGALGGLFGN